MSRTDAVPFLHVSHHSATQHSRPIYAIDAVDHALRAIHMLRDGGSTRVTEVARQLQISPSSAHRLMAMLVYQGFAIQDDSRRYLAGPALSAPIIASGDTKKMVDASRPLLEQLCDELGETVNLTSRVGMHARVLMTVEARSLGRIGDRTGAVLPAHATSAGRALLAAEPLELSQRLYRSKNADRLGLALPDGVYRQLIRELKATRQRGYALCWGETQIGVASAAVPVTSATGRPLTTITVSTPVSRLESLYKKQVNLDKIFRAQHDLGAALACVL
ncbi:IclR family transcriptional regulator [Arthrobacter sp. 2MCAF14]|uniref:IclR family transcriptional regulator n=1 Tax=Arthrobacter sp. 2MCAF14 TaxID=3232982 RepID=UPI003F902849